MANLKNLLVTGTGRFTDKVYASEFIGTITRALADGDGNTFQSTYSKATGLVNGSVFPSVRMISAAAESDDYKLGSCAFAEGASTKASGTQSHAEGAETTASGNQCHAEGYKTTADGSSCHAEGWSTTASDSMSHAEGYGTTANGPACHAEGMTTIASSTATHAEGNLTEATGTFSHSEGYGTLARGFCQHSQGRYNVEDANGTYAHIVGNGNSDTTRSNAHTLDWNGNAWFKGSIYLGGTGQTDSSSVMVLPAKLVSTTTTPSTNNTIYWLYE